MSEVTILRPEILRAKIIEIMGRRSFIRDDNGVLKIIWTIEDLLTKDIPEDRRAHLEQAQNAIKSLAEHGYPNEALKFYMPRYDAMYSKLSI